MLLDSDRIAIRRRLTFLPEKYLMLLSILLLKCFTDVFNIIRQFNFPVFSTCSCTMGMKTSSRSFSLTSHWALKPITLEGKSIKR